MTSNQKPTGRAMSMPGGLAAGGLRAILVTVLTAAILAKLIEREILKEESIGYGVMLLLTAASLTGAMTAVHRIRHQRILVCAASGILYWGILLAITAIFFGGQYEAVAETGLLILCGSALAAFCSAASEGKGRDRKHRIPT